MHVNLPDLSPDDPGGGDVGYVLDLRLDDVVGQVVKLALVEPPAHEGDENDGDLGDVEFPDDRVFNFLGQIGASQIDDLQHIGLGAVQVGSPVEIDRNQGGALPGDGLRRTSPR